MLWNSEVHCVDYLRVRNYIANFIKCIENCPECATLVMNYQSFDIFQEECLRLIPAKNFCYIKEQSASCFLKSQSFTCKRECLTRKSSAKYVKTLWYFILDRLLGYVTEGNVTIVGIVSLSCLFIPFRRKYTFTSQILECHSKTTNSSEKVDERKLGVMRCLEWCLKQVGEKILLHGNRRFCNHTTLYFIFNLLSYNKFIPHA